MVLFLSLLVEGVCVCLSLNHAKLMIGSIYSITGFFDFSHWAKRTSAS